VAGDESLGWDWRKRYLQLTYQAGTYRPYEGIIREAALDVGLAPQAADALIERWSELQPWPETREVLRALQEKVPLAVATNCSRTLAATAVAALDVRIAHVVTAEDAGYYRNGPVEIDGLQRWNFSCQDHPPAGRSQLRQVADT
jgi:2-haloacid dehalogenase